MNISTDSVITGIGVLAEVVFCALLTRRRVYQHLPIFYAYLIWGVISDSVVLLLNWRFPAQYVKIYIVEVSLDSLLQYGVLVELAASVLRPLGGPLPRRTMLGISLLVLLLGAAAWPLTTFPGLSHMELESQILLRLVQTFAILRIVIFLALAAGSHVLAIGWRDRELQVATGLGFFSLASLTANLLHTHQVYSHHYHLVDQLVAVSYIGSLLFWTVSFARKDAPRREFTPQMQNFLLSVAGTASGHRTAFGYSNANERPNTRR